MTTTVQPEPGGDWRDLALCRTIGDPALWFPPPGDNALAAKQICTACPVRAACLDEAMRSEGSAASSGRYGVRGGLGPSQRRDLYDADRDHWQGGPETEAARCLRLHAAGYGIKSIAALLGISTRTVHRYVANDPKGAR